MPSGQIHLRFDRILRENGIIELGDEECDEMHGRMDRDMYKYGGPWHHQERDPHHQEAGVRQWIGNGRDSVGEKIADLIAGLTLGVVDVNPYGHVYSHYMRVAYGHIVLDNYWAKYRQELESGEKSEDDVIELAFQNFRDKGYDNARFRS